MSTQLMRQGIVTVIEQARAAWNAGGHGYQLLVDYENRNAVDLASQVDPYLAVDIVFRDGEQIDLGDSPVVCDDGQIMLAVGVKEGSGTQKASELLDFIRPYLQLRDDIPNGVRTRVGRPQPPKTLVGFYYLPLVVGFWRHAQAPATP
jgi:hypothetical protein